MPMATAYVALSWLSPWNDSQPHGSRRQIRRAAEKEMMRSRCSTFFLPSDSKLARSGRKPKKVEREGQPIKVSKPNQ